MGILPYKVLCNAAFCVFHVFLLKVALSKVFDLDIEMKRKSRAVQCCFQGAGSQSPLSVDKNLKTGKVSHFEYTMDLKKV